jgi:integrase
MALVLKRLERAHRDGTWPALALTVPFTYDWFHSVQRYMNTFTASEHTLHAAMSACFTIVQERSRCAPTVSWQTVLEQVTQTKRNSCPRSLAQVVRRLYMVANVVWYEFLKEWLHPLRPPRLPWSLRRSPDDVPTRVFTDAEVQRIVDVAPAVSPYAEALVRLLFSTGLRIGAVARLRWENILVDGSPPHIAAGTRRQSQRVSWGCAAGADTAGCGSPGAPTAVRVRACRRARAARHGCPTGPSAGAPESPLRRTAGNRRQSPRVPQGRASGPELPTADRRRLRVTAGIATVWPRLGPAPVASGPACACTWGR